MVGSSERISETLMAIANFSFYEAQLTSLEHEIKKQWPVLKNDLRLTHQLTEKLVGEWGHASKMADWAFLKRLQWTQLSAFNTVPGISLPKLSKRLISELSNLARTSDRLEILDDQLEVFEDLYELVNDRISEYSYFLREYKVELWIVVLLVAEVVLLIIELLPRG
jgi:hypothetical protein